MGTEKKLAGYGIHTMGDIAMASLRSEDWLYKMFGIDAELLIDHASQTVFSTFLYKNFIADR